MSIASSRGQLDRGDLMHTALAAMLTIRCSPKKPVSEWGRIRAIQVNVGYMERGLQAHTWKFG